jgi:2'-5' RNA ligase
MDKAPTKMFVGIRVPTDIATSLASFRSNYPDDLPGVRWTDADDLHITLKYLGRQTTQAATSITDGLANISQPPVEIALNGAGVFEDVGVLFISIATAPALMRLQQAVDQVALGYGVSRSEHSYRPHISIARFDTTNVVPDPTSEFDRMSLHLGEFCQGLPNRHFRATEIVLYDSVSGHYRERFNLQLNVEAGNF